VALTWHSTTSVRPPLQAYAAHSCRSTPSSLLTSAWLLQAALGQAACRQAQTVCLPAYAQHTTLLMEAQGRRTLSCMLQACCCSTDILSRCRAGSCRNTYDAITKVQMLKCIKASPAPARYQDVAARSPSIHQPHICKACALLQFM
jgi:hypothetical protein